LDSLQLINNPTEEISENQIPRRPDQHKRKLAIQSLVLLLIFMFGFGSGYLMGRNPFHQATQTVRPLSDDESMALVDELNPPEGHTIHTMFGDVGPQLVAAGAIDLSSFSALYKQQNQPLTDDQKNILTKGSNLYINIQQSNAYFLLNFFWALGLTNENPILTEGMMMSGGADQIGGFASTGGWTLGTKPATELYASQKILTLTDEQQTRLSEVAAQVYRPCCNNPTTFPDCNHGMAMLGLLELMASQGASSDQMYEAAKYVTAFWYPQQMLEVASMFKILKNVDFTDADSRQVVGSQYSSVAGFQTVHQWLSQNGLLKQAPNSGGSCGVR